MTGPELPDVELLDNSPVFALFVPDGDAATGTEVGVIPEFMGPMKISTQYYYLSVFKRGKTKLF